MSKVGELQEILLSYHDSEAFARVTDSLIAAAEARGFEKGLAKGRTEEFEMVKDVEAFARGREEGAEQMKIAAEMLWIVVANVNGGDWSKQSAEWQEAAARWRDFYFSVLSPAPIQKVRGEPSQALLDELSEICGDKVTYEPASPAPKEKP